MSVDTDKNGSTPKTAVNEAGVSSTTVSETAMSSEAVTNTFMETNNIVGDKTSILIVPEVTATTNAVATVDVPPAAVANLIDDVLNTTDDELNVPAHEVTEVDTFFAPSTCTHEGNLTPSAVTTVDVPTAIITNPPGDVHTTPIAIITVADNVLTADATAGAGLSPRTIAATGVPFAAINATIFSTTAKLMCVQPTMKTSLLHAKVMVDKKHLHFIQWTY